VEPVGQVGVCRFGAEVDEGEDRHGGTVVSQGRREPGGRRRGSSPWIPDPEHGEGGCSHHQESRYHHQLGAAHPLAPLFSVIPGQDQGDEKPESHGHDEDLANHFRPAELVPHVTGGFQDGPGPGQVGQRPLNELSLLQMSEKRGIGCHSRAPEGGFPHHCGRDPSNTTTDSCPIARCACGLGGCNKAARAAPEGEGDTGASPGRRNAP